MRDRLLFIVSYQRQLQRENGNPGAVFRTSPSCRIFIVDRHDHHPVYLQVEVTLNAGMASLGVAGTGATIGPTAGAPAAADAW